MSGPVRTEDVPPVDGGSVDPGHPVLEVTPSRVTEVGALQVRRALPRRTRRTVGAWCFVDHMGPVAVTEERGVDIGPHPHIGLQTVTWLLAGEVLHHDGLGSEQVIRPGELNLMSAGHGIAHAEEATGRYRGDLHGVQLWVAQPERTRHGAPAFAHHADLPRVDLASATATVLVGDLDGTASPARHDTDGIGVDLALRPGATTVVPLRPRFEHALVVLDGAVSIDSNTRSGTGTGTRSDSPGGGDSGGTATSTDHTVVVPGHLAYLGDERDELALSVREPTRVLLLGGVPFESPITMWWNFVARTHDEIDEARDAWESGDDRFAPVASQLDPIAAPPTPW